MSCTTEGRMTTDLNKIRHNALMAWHADAHPLMKNEDGTPKTFYHGTLKSFDAFEPSDHGHFFSEKPNRAAEFAHHVAMNHGDEEGHGVNVMPVHLNIKNPFIANSKSLRKIAKEIGHPVDHPSTGRTGHDSFVQGFEDSEYPHREAVRNYVKAKGHDGMIISRDLMPKVAGGDWSFMRSVVAFHPDQIKSVYNSGAYGKTKNISEAFFTKDEVRARAWPAIDKFHDLDLT